MAVKTMQQYVSIDRRYAMTSDVHYSGNGSVALYLSYKHDWLIDYNWNIVDRGVK